MCGIVGSISKIDHGRDASLFTQAIDSLIHRGPDDGGIWYSSNGLIQLGHRRLSIIDLGEGGSQPKLDSSKNFVIVFNGEIYNFLDLKEQLRKVGVNFLSDSDTEVLVEGYKIWGKDILQKIEGMFAFAIYDEGKHELFIARDIAGEKPLFFYNDEGNFLFGSEHRSVRKLSSQQSIDNSSFSEYLMKGYVGSSKSLTMNINQLEPASYLILDCHSLTYKINKYWEPPSLSLQKKTLRNLEHELTQLLLKSVEKTLISDVPVGILLSGGLDSSLITAIASSFNSNLKTFSVSFSSHSGFDESQHSRLIANAYKTDHIELNASEISAERFEFLASNFDLPIGDTSIIPTFLLSEEVSKHCKVVLGGDGADELFGGYHRYSQIEKISNIAVQAPKILKKIIIYASMILPTGTRAKQWINLLRDDFNVRVRNPSIFFDKSDQAKLLNQSISTLEPIYKEDHFFVDSSGLVNNLSKLDFLNYLPNDILLKVDRSSMLNSLEVRAPFLSKDIIEFSFRYLSSDLKIRDGEKKYLLKQVAKKILPKDFNFSRKQGFSFPFLDLLEQDEWNALFKKYLYSNHSCFDHNYIKSLRSNKFNFKNNSERLFSLLFFEIWRQNNLDPLAKIPKSA